MIDNLDEAIAHAKEKEAELKQKSGFDTDNERYAMSDQERADCIECANEHRQLADWLMELKERREADRWIPVSERLPESGNKAYLVTVDYGLGVTTSCQRFFFNDEIGWNDDSVIAWKPLPEPYKENDK